MFLFPADCPKKELLEPVVLLAPLNCPKKELLPPVEVAPAPNPAKRLVVPPTLSTRPPPMLYCVSVLIELVALMVPVTL